MHAIPFSFPHNAFEAPIKSVSTKILDLLNTNFNEDLPLKSSKFNISEYPREEGEVQKKEPKKITKKPAKKPIKFEEEIDQPAVIKVDVDAIVLSTTGGYNLAGLDEYPPEDE